jgi:hypothetical protein
LELHDYEKDLIISTPPDFLKILNRNNALARIKKEEEEALQEEEWREKQVNGKGNEKDEHDKDLDQMYHRVKSMNHIIQNRPIKSKKKLKRSASINRF